MALEMTNGWMDYLKEQLNRDLPDEFIKRVSKGWNEGGKFFTWQESAMLLMKTGLKNGETEQSRRAEKAFVHNFLADLKIDIADFKHNFAEMDTTIAEMNTAIKKIYGMLQDEYPRNTEQLKKYQENNLSLISILESQQRTLESQQREKENTSIIHKYLIEGAEKSYKRAEECEAEAKLYKKESFDLRDKLSSLQKEFDQSKTGVASFNLILTNANNLIREGKFEEAQNLLDLSSDGIDIHFASTFHLKAKAYELDLKYSNALRYYRLAVGIQPDNVEFVYSLGSFLHVINLNRESLQILYSALELLPNNEEYLFSWDDIPVNDNSRLIEFLKKSLGIELAETAKIEKIDDGKTIKVSTEIDSISVKLNDDKTKVNLTINDVRIDEFIARMEKSKLNIYNEQNLIERKSLFNSIGLALIDLGEYDEAISFFNKALDIQFNLFGKILYPDAISYFNNLGAAYDKKGEFITALQYYDHVRKATEFVFGKDDIKMGTYYNNLGNTYLNIGHLYIEEDGVKKDVGIQEALFCLNRALDIVITNGMENQSFASVIYQNLSRAFRIDNDKENSIKCLKKAFLINQKLFGEKNKIIVKNYLNLGKTFIYFKDPKNALEYFEKAYNICRDIYGYENQKTQTVKLMLDDCKNDILN
jgi:tetratricopeptide (TPR) repeat protein